MSSTMFVSLPGVVVRSETSERERAHIHTSATKLRSRSKRRNHHHNGTSSSKKRKLREESSSKGSADSRRHGKRRRRQKRNVNNKGYYEMTEVERVREEAKTRAKLERNKQRMLAMGHMFAPYNSTQFLIHDSNDDCVKRLDEVLHDSQANSDVNSPNGSPTKVRSRNSSFSFDENDDDYFYSSPDDEQEFLNKEFSKDYEKGTYDRLEQMEKDELILEYLGMEKHIESLEKRLQDVRERETMKELTGEVDYQFSRGEVPMEPDMAQKILVHQSEIRRLMKENKVLHAENARLKRKFAPARSRSSSTDSSEDETPTLDDDDDSGGGAAALDEAIVGSSLDDEGKTEDTGYESTQSKEQTPERDLILKIKRHWDDS